MSQRQARDRDGGVFTYEVDDGVPDPSHHIIFDWGPGSVSCSCGWHPSDRGSGGNDWQERQWEQHVDDDIKRPRDARDVDVDPESVRGSVLRFYDAMDEVRRALGVEWYNGNMTGPAHDRLEAMVAKMVANDPPEPPSTHE